MYPATIRFSNNTFDSLAREVSWSSGWHTDFSEITFVSTSAAVSDALSLVKPMELLEVEVLFEKQVFEFKGFLTSIDCNFSGFMDDPIITYTITIKLQRTVRHHKQEIYDAGSPYPIYMPYNKDGNQYEFNQCNPVSKRVDPLDEEYDELSSYYEDDDFYEDYS